MNCTILPQPAPTRFESRLDIGEGLHALRVEVVMADHFAILINANLTCYENKFGRFHSRHMRVLTKRLAERVGVDDLDLRHHLFPPR